MRISMNIDELKIIFGKITKACDGKDSSRQMLRAVHLEFEGNRCTAVALNGYILAMHEAPCTIIEGEGRIVLNVMPDKLQQFTAQVVELSDEIEGFLQISGFAQKQLMPLSPKGDYIDWRKVVNPKHEYPQDAPRRIAFDPALLRIVCEIAGKHTILMKLGSEVQSAWCDVGIGTKVLILPVRISPDGWEF